MASFFFFLLRWPSRYLLWLRQNCASYRPPRWLIVRRFYCSQRLSIKRWKDDSDRKLRLEMHHLSTSRLPSLSQTHLRGQKLVSAQNQLKLLSALQKAKNWYRAAKFNDRAMRNVIYISLCGRLNLHAELLENLREFWLVDSTQRDLLTFSCG